MVPNEIHFIWLTEPTSRPFNYINSIAIKAAADVQKPDRIYMHCNKEPTNNPYWNEIRSMFSMRWVEAPDSHDGVPLEYIQYKADVLRLQILRDHGGIYLDTDSLMLKPLTPFMDKPFTLAEESPDSYAMAPIIAEPGARFIDIWLQRMANTMRAGGWAKHAVQLPREIHKMHPALCDVRPREEFFPFDLRRNYLFDDGRADEWIEQASNAYVLHVYETYWKDYLADVRPGYMRQRDTVFSRLFRKYE